MDIDGTVGWADWFRFAVLCATWWFAFQMGRGYEKEVSKMDDRDRSP